MPVDVSASNARSTSQAANQDAGTVINFSSPGSWFGGTDQSATPTSSATAATKSPGTSSYTPGAEVTGPGSNWTIFAALGAVLVLLVFLVLKR